MSIFEEVGQRVGEGLEDAAQQLNEVGCQPGYLLDQTWNDLEVDDEVDNASQTANDISDAAWAVVSETASHIPEGLREGIKDGAYIAIRADLGVADVVEDAYKGGRVWVEKALGHDDVAVEVAQTDYVDQTVDALNEAFDVSDSVKTVGDVSQTAKKLVTEVGLGVAATAAAAPVAVVAGGVTVAAAAGGSLEASAEDGELSNEDMTTSAVKAGVAAAAIGVGRYFAQAAEAVESGVDQVGGSYKDVKSLVDSEVYEVHHMPANAINELKTGDGPCIAMLKGDHWQTASWGNSIDAKLYRAAQSELVEAGKRGEALMMDVEDVMEKFPGKYDEAISQAIKYATELGWF